MLVRRFCLVLSLFLFLTAVSFAATEEYTFQGQTIAPEFTQIKGKTVVSLDDPEIQKLVSLTSSRLTRSAKGGVLMVYNSIHQTTITASSPSVKVDGNDEKACGLMFSENGKEYIEPSLLFSALCLKERTENGKSELLTQIGAPLFTDKADGRVIEIPLASSIRWQSTTKALNDVKLVFPGCTWQDPNENKFKVDDVLFAVTEEINPKTNINQVVMEVTSPNNWKAETRKGLDLSQAIVAFTPTYPKHAGTLLLQEAKVEKSDNLHIVSVKVSEPFQYYWNYNHENRTLTVDFPDVNASRLPEQFESPLGLTNSVFKQVGNMSRPVMRWEAELTEGYSFVFPDNVEDKGLLQIHISDEPSQALKEGSGATFGYMPCRGVIVLDPGHGGGDPGCISRLYGVYEKDVTLDVALRLKEVLEEKGWTVILTRETDRDVSWLNSPNKVELQARCDVANKIDADYFISLHCNASVSPSPAGTSMHWYKSEDYELARALEYSLGESLGLDEDGTIRNNFYVLRNTKMPAVLVEMAFLSNPYEGRLLSQPSFRQRIAENLAGAILNHATAVYARTTSRPAVKSAP